MRHRGSNELRYAGGTMIGLVLLCMIAAAGCLVANSSAPHLETRVYLMDVPGHAEVPSVLVKSR